MSRPQFELLAPAGDLERLDAALRFGADAVYLGGPMLQLRAGSAGLSMESLGEAARRAHAAGKRLYVAVNAFAGNADVDTAGDYAQALEALGADAVIVSDLGVISAVRRAAPKLEIHVSTQANCLNYAAAMTYFDLGARRVVLGREMSLAEIRALRARTPDELELEAFVHGAMCMAYSGRCMISAHLAGRSANAGGCAQSCRWQYHLVEQKRPGEFFPVEEDAEGTTILSARDLSCMGFLDQLMDAGVRSFKLEGRMKSPFYVATVTNAYRMRIDALLRGDRSPALLEALERELRAASHRAYSSGFYFGEAKHLPPDGGSYLQETRFVGTVLGVEAGRAFVELRNRIPEGARLEALSPSRLGLSFFAHELRDEAGARVEAANVPGRAYSMDCPLPLSRGDLLRIRLEEETK